MAKVLLGVLILGIGPLVAAPVPREHRKSEDKTRLLGTWNMLSCSVSGKTQKATWNTLTLDASGRAKAEQDGNAVFEYFGTIDPTATPRRMPWCDKPGGQILYECVFGFRGSTLIVVVPHDHQKPPTSLEPGPRVTVYEFERSQK